MYVIVLFHTDVAWAGGSFIAVNLFFVLSGYLVTTVIVTEIERNGRLDLGRFYAGRTRRLLPAALLAIVGTSLIFVMVEPVVRRVGVIGDAQSALLYVSNWRFIAESTDYFATDVDKSPFLHFWTLSIEEQFYVVFPLVLVALFKLGGRRAAALGTGVLLVASLAAQFLWAATDPTRAYFGTDARAYQLLTGVLLSFLLMWRPPRVRPGVASALALGGMASFVALSVSLAPLSQSVRGVLGTAACLAIVAGLMMREEQLLGRLLSGRAATYLGQISYSTYLWHWPAILVLGLVLDVGPVVMAVLAGVLATSMAAASNELLELPVRKAAVLQPLKWRTTTVGVTASALVAVLVAPAVLSWDRTPDIVTADPRQVSDQPSATSTGSPAPLPEQIDWQRVRGDRGRSVSCGPEDPSECTVHRATRPDAPHVVLVGDSHAAMLAEMWLRLARRHDFTLSLNTVLGCPWQENLQNVQSGKERRAACTAARAGWYDSVLPRLDADVAVLAGFPREDRGRWASKIRERDGSGRPLLQATLAATRATLRTIDRHTQRLLLIEAIVTPDDFEPNECLTRTGDPGRCLASVPTGTSRTTAYYLTEATENQTYHTVDLNPAFCPAAPLCEAVVDGDVVWRDDEHLYSPYAARRAGQAWREIRRSGVFAGMDPGVT